MKTGIENRLRIMVYRKNRYTSLYYLYDTVKNEIIFYTALHQIFSTGDSLNETDESKERQINLNILSSEKVRCRHVISVDSKYHENDITLYRLSIWCVLPCI